MASDTAHNGGLTVSRQGAWRREALSQQAGAIFREGSFWIDGWPAHWFPYVRLSIMSLGMQTYTAMSAPPAIRS